MKKIILFSLLSLSAPSFAHQNRPSAIDWRSPAVGQELALEAKSGQYNLINKLTTKLIDQGVQIGGSDEVVNAIQAAQEEGRPVTYDTIIDELK